MADFTIDSATEGYIVVSKRVGSLADQSALRRFVAQAMVLKESDLAVHQGAGYMSANRYRVTPQPGREEAFAEAVKKYNEGQAAS